MLTAKSYFSAIPKTTGAALPCRGSFSLSRTTRQREGSFESQVGEGAVALHVVGEEDAAGEESGPGGVELAAHVAAGVEAVVDEEAQGADLAQQAGQDALAGAAVEPPSPPELVRHGDAPVAFVLPPEGRQVHAVERSAAVLLQGLQDVGRADAVGHPRLDDRLGVESRRQAR